MAAEAVGKRRTYLVFGVIAAFAGLGIAVAPGSVPAIGIACFAVLGLGLGLLTR
jgi:glucuronide carrier protein